MPVSLTDLDEVGRKLSDDDGDVEDDGVVLPEALQPKADAGVFSQLPVSALVIWLFVLTVGLVLCVALALVSALVLADGEPASTDVVDVQDNAGVAEAVAAKCVPSVASIAYMGLDDKAVVSGSGVVIDEQGHVLTNNHVVSSRDRWSVTIDGSTYSATLLGKDESSDLAVLQLDAQDVSFSPMEVGDSSGLSVGEWVMAIGCPFGLDRSISVGVVSSLYRSTAMSSGDGKSLYVDMIQTDAAINPGNSGGALVDASGQLVGITSIIQSYSGTSSGVGFAIPSNYAMRVANAILAGEPTEHATLGIDAITVTADMALQAGLPVNSGACVTNVEANGPAALGGIAQGDVITKVGDRDVATVDALMLAVRAYMPGESVPVEFWRGAERLIVDVMLGSDA